jgi:hypothetical protein
MILHQEKLRLSNRHYSPIEAGIKTGIEQEGSLPGNDFSSSGSRKGNEAFDGPQ